MIKPLFPLLVLTVAACTPTEAPTESASPVVENSAPVLSVDLEGNDMPLVVELGDAATLGVDAPSTAWNEETGRVEVKAGDHFSLLISEEPGDLARLKADLERDVLRTHQIIQDSPEHVVYRSQFPDDALVFVHFYRIIKVDGREFVVQDDPAGRYNEADIERMARSVRTQRPV